jgi:hypothetical protein
MTIGAERPVHLLLCGPPSSGKSLFMSSPISLERSYYAVGSSSTKSGIFDYLFEQRPRYFIVDELEKMTGLLAVPVLAGSAGYALADGFGWKEGLGKKFKDARSFYLVIAIAPLAGLAINFISIDPVQSLVYAAVINRVVAVLILIALMTIDNDKEILQDRTNGKNIIPFRTDHYFDNGSSRCDHVCYVQI